MGWLELFKKIQLVEEGLEIAGGSDLCNHMNT